MLKFFLRVVLNFIGRSRREKLLRFLQGFEAPESGVDILVRNNVPDIPHINLNDPNFLTSISHNRIFNIHEKSVDRSSSNAREKKKIYLFNDTSFSRHAGCRAVMRSIDHQLQGYDVIARHYVNQYHFNKAIFEQADIIFVNGEGTIHHAQKSGNFLMEALRLGQEMGKKTILVNAVFQQEDKYYEDVIKKLDFFSVREPLSLENAKRSGGNPMLLLDSCADKDLLDFSVKPLFEMPKVSKGTSVACGDYYNFLHSLDYPYYHIIDTEIPFEYVISTLKTTNVYITGQHHAVYACGLAGIAFVDIPSNSHKIEGIIKWSGLDIPLYKEGDNIGELVEYAQNNQKMFLEFRDFLLSKEVFTAGLIKDLV